jgi:hypothetical protein
MYPNLRSNLSRINYLIAHYYAQTQNDTFFNSILSKLIANTQLKNCIKINSYIINLLYKKELTNKFK